MKRLICTREKALSRFGLGVVQGPEEVVAHRKVMGGDLYEGRVEEGAGQFQRPWLNHLPILIEERVVTKARSGLTQEPMHGIPLGGVSEPARTTTGLFAAQDVGDDRSAQ